MSVFPQSETEDHCRFLVGVTRSDLGLTRLPGGSVVKNLPANERDAGDASSIPGLERSPREGNDYPLHYSCLENPMDRLAGYSPWGHKSLTQLSN